MLEVRTTQPGIQLYTGNPHAFALETQHYPDSVNHTNFPSTILRPGETYKSTTVLSFFAKVGPWRTTFAIRNSSFTIPDIFLSPFSLRWTLLGR